MHAGAGSGVSICFGATFISEMEKLAPRHKEKTTNYRFSGVKCSRKEGKIEDLEHLRTKIHRTPFSHGAVHPRICYFRDKFREILLKLGGFPWNELNGS